jgi:hypothetical protein
MADERTIPELLTDLYEQVTTLVRQEILLARTELYETLSGLTRGVAIVAAGALILFSGGLVLLAACVLVISRLFGTELWLSAIIVAAFAGIAGGVLVQSGMTRLRGTRVIPTHPLTLAKEQVTWQREPAE